MQISYECSPYILHAQKKKKKNYPIKLGKKIIINHQYNVECVCSCVKTLRHNKSAGKTVRITKSNKKKNH